MLQSRAGRAPQRKVQLLTAWRQKRAQQSQTHCTEPNLLKHNRAERRRAVHTKATTAAAVMVLSALLAADEGRRDVSVLVSAL